MPCHSVQSIQTFCIPTLAYVYIYVKTTCTHTHTQQKKMSKETKITKHIRHFSSVMYENTMFTSLPYNTGSVMLIANSDMHNTEILPSSLQMTLEHTHQKKNVQCIAMSSILHVGRMCSIGNSFTSYVMIELVST